MSISLVLERLTPEYFCRIEDGQYPDGRPVARESGIDKDWGVLLALLVNDEDPPPFVSKALTGPPELVEDGDWFHARRLRDPAMTGQVARALQALDESELEERYYRVDISSAYGAPDAPNGDDFSRIRDAFRLLRDFYLAASAAGDAISFQLRG